MQLPSECGFPATRFRLFGTRYYSPYRDFRMEIDEKYMSLAVHEAQKALQEGEVPIGCIIVSGGQIVGRGHNMTEALHDVTAHAEIQAITAAAQTLGGK